MHAVRQPGLAEMALFATVVEEGSFTAAARALGMPKSSLSRRIAELEERLGVLLLTRTTRKLAPTDAGGRFHAYCARLVVEAEEARAAIAAAASSPVGLVRITAPVAFGTAYLGSIAAEVLESFPGVRLEIVLSSRLVDLVEEGFDIAVRIGKPLAVSSLVSRKVGRARRLLCASPAYLERRGTPTSLEDLANHDLLIQGDSTRPASWSFRGPEGAKVIPVRGRLWSNHPNILLRAAIHGLGIGCLPGPIAAPDRLSGRLCPVLPAEMVEESDVHIMYSSSRHMPASVRACLGILVPRLREQLLAVSR